MYICHYIIKYIDIIMYKIDNMSFDLVYFHYTVAYFYIALLTAYYFYKRGFKRFIYYPLIVAGYIMILIYSPFPKIRYYYEGAIFISYRGDRLAIQTKNIVDKEKIKSITLSNKLIDELYEINIGGEIKLKKEGKNYILKTNNKEYLLFVNYEEVDGGYDIIDFRKGDIKEITVFKDNIIN